MGTAFTADQRTDGLALPDFLKYLASCAAQEVGAVPAFSGVHE
jgi:hypothetical protein